MAYSETLNAIEAYLAKADKDLKKKLLDEGFINVDETVAEINNLTDELTVMLEKEGQYLLNGIDDATELEKFIDEILVSNLLNDTTSNSIKELFRTFFETFTETNADGYMKIFDKEIGFSTFTDRTLAWIDYWSEDLGNLMQLTTHERIQDILSTALSNGDSIQAVKDNLIDAYVFSEDRARKTAITEVLTAHSYAKQEAIIQSPVVDRKEWRHSGAKKNKPRPHHQELDGTIIPKGDKFTIYAPSGTFECDFPRDVMLPASERINCHCIHRAITMDDVTGLTVEQKQELQKKAIDEDNKAWEAELDAKNKAKAGIEE